VSKCVLAHNQVLFPLYGTNVAWKTEHRANAGTFWSHLRGAVGTRLEIPKASKGVVSLLALE